MVKKLYIKTYGCQMNVYDSERMAEILSPLGFELSDDASEADMVILNTCHIREKAAEKVYSELGRLNNLRENKIKSGANRSILAVTGCVAQAEGEQILSRAPFVDMVFGPQTYHRLPQMIAEAARKGGQVLDTEFPVESKFDLLDVPRTLNGASAFLTVQEGCDKFCTYCVVPYTRGAESSRPVSSVMAEANELAGAGAKEITLVGQNVNAYHGIDEDGEARGLASLIKAVADIETVKRIRYITSYPAEVDDDLIAAHRDIEKLMPYLHLPIQSGSDKILKAMNRRHNAAQYRALAEKIMATRPDMALSSDFIVGFPGETERDFEDTCDIVRDIGFVQSYSFVFSPRPGTPAAMMEEQIDEQVKSERLARLQKLLNANTLRFNEQSIGKTMEVLFDRRGKKPGQLVGRSPYMQAVVVEADDKLMNQIASVKITNGYGNSLFGELIDNKNNERFCA
ncbi:MAG: tRNA (N6-isopentenyl adenosine(37)-C2)-methylthiotransferase MiaB [Rhodospirillaceae bacterium]|nr:tRNA (N6-isopentenyl adenosine(37)-C2)-methylthiotransferase MiaB [Rhodospirillaceae bacterium]